MQKRFSLVELLLLMMLLAIMSSLLIPSLNKMLGTVRQLECASSNMNALYLGIATYSEDYNDSLPGPASYPKPLWVKNNLNGVGAVNRSKSSGLQYFLHPYLKDSGHSGVQFMAEMQCPENKNYELTFTDEKRSSYFLAKNIDHEEEVSEFVSTPLTSNTYTTSSVQSREPFGKIEFYRSEDSFHRGGLEPMKMFQLNPSADQGLYDSFWDAGRTWIYPRYPIHVGQSINLMYLDGHVEEYIPDIFWMLENKKKITQIL